MYACRVCHFTRLKTYRLFQVDIDRREQCCAANYEQVVNRDAGTTGAAGASAPLAFCIFNFVGAVRVQTMGVTGAQNFYNRQN